MEANHKNVTKFSEYQIWYDKEGKLTNLVTVYNRDYFEQVSKDDLIDLLKAVTWMLDKMEVL